MMPYHGEIERRGEREPISFNFNVVAHAVNVCFALVESFKKYQTYECSCEEIRFVFAYCTWSTDKQEQVRYCVSICFDVRK